MIKIPVPGAHFPISLLDVFIVSAGVGALANSMDLYYVKELSNIAGRCSTLGILLSGIPYYTSFQNISMLLLFFSDKLSCESSHE